MEATLNQNVQAKYHSLDEFADKLAKRLGQHYGMKDIFHRVIPQKMVK